MERCVYLIVLCFFIMSCSSSHSDGTTERETDSLTEKGRWVSIKDANGENGYYLFENKIYGLDFGLRDTTEINYWIRRLRSIYPIPGADAETFEICINADYEPYARDRHKVYYHDLSVTEFFDGEEIGGEIYRGDISINGADTKTFKYIGDGYAVDKYNMYHEGQKTLWNESMIKLLNCKPTAIQTTP